MKQRKGYLPFAVAGLTVAALALAAPAAASNAIYLKCESSFVVTDGDLAADSIGEELAGQSHPMDVVAEYALVLSYTEGTQSTPQPTGGGVSDYLHSGLTIVRPVAKSSPRFMRALFTGQVWAECELDFWRKGSSDWEIYMQIKIGTVNVVQIEPRAVTNFESAGSGKNHLEAITFTFKEIEWSQNDGPVISFRFNLETGTEG